MGTTTATLDNAPTDNKGDNNGQQLTHQMNEVHNDDKKSGTKGEPGPKGKSQDCKKMTMESHINAIIGAIEGNTVDITNLQVKYDKVIKQEYIENGPKVNIASMLPKLPPVIDVEENDNDNISNSSSNDETSAISCESFDSKHITNMKHNW